MPDRSPSALVSHLLAMDLAAPEAVMPLVRRAAALPGPLLSEIRARIFESPVPATVKTGLYLYFGCWDEAHEAADSVEHPDGYYWHTIVHRQEPDPGNARYWFTRTGPHPVFPRLRVAAEELGYNPGCHWNSGAFIQFCEGAAQRLGSAEEELAIEVQMAEWRLLLEHCAGTDLTGAWN